MNDQQRARELKPCPFCGGQPQPGFASTGVPELEDCGYCYIECCDVHIHRDDEEACAEAWNRRAAPDAVALRTAMETLEQIATAPDDQGAKLNAAAAVAFLTTQGAGGPEGFVLVPVEPTPAMVVAGGKAAHDGDGMSAKQFYPTVYRAMLAARPQGVKDV